VSELLQSPTQLAPHAVAVLATVLYWSVRDVQSVLAFDVQSFKRRCRDESPLARASHALAASVAIVRLAPEPVRLQRRWRGLH